MPNLPIDQLELFNQSKTPGIAAMVIQSQKILHQRGYGLRRLEDQSPILPSSNFNLASISKIFTAAAILLLEGQNLIKASDSLGKFFETSYVYKSITLEQLIHHASGIPNYAKRHWNERRFINNEKIVNYLKDEELESLPGEKFEYNDTGYILLASIIEKVSSMSYFEFLNQNIFDKCNMKNSTVYLPGSRIQERVYGYTEWPFFELDDEYPGDMVYGDGAIYSSLFDLQEWILTLEQEKLFAKETMRKMFKCNLKMKIPYGYGWFIDNYRGFKQYYHDGEWVGFRNYIVNLPEKALWVVILSNSSGIKAGAIAKKLLDIYA